jgi:hypothetical protein
MDLALILFGAIGVAVMGYAFWVHHDWGSDRSDGSAGYVHNDDLDASWPDGEDGDRD